MKKLVLLSFFLWSLLLTASPHQANFEPYAITDELDDRKSDSTSYPLEMLCRGIGTHDEISGGGEEKGARTKQLFSSTNRTWFFGNNAGLDFSTDPPSPISGHALDAYEGAISISDARGNLLFYTNGTTIWDDTHTERITGLKGDFSATQSVLVVPSLTNRSEYYVFTTDGSRYAAPPINHFDGGLLNVDNWSFTQLSELMSMPDTTNFSPTERLTAVPYSEGEGAWVITIIQEGPLSTYKGNGFFRIFAMDSEGLRHHSDIPMGIVYELGYLKASPDHQKLALADGYSGNVRVFPFDNATGTIDVAAELTIKTKLGIVYGIEFSPDSKLLYYGSLPSNLTASIYQVDLSIRSAIAIKVGSVPPAGYGHALGALQLGPDGRIYFARQNAKKIGAILEPNTAGTGCKVNNNFIYLKPRTHSAVGLPNLHFANPKIINEVIP